MLTQTIEINLTQSKLSSIIMRSEEKGREIAFSVIDEAGDPVALEDYSVKFLMLKPDDNVIYADVVSGVLTQTEQMTTSKGAGYYCIRIIDAGTVIYSGQGRVLIDDHVIDDETLDSISEVDGYIFPDDFATHAWVEEYVDEHTGSDVIANPDTPPTDTLETVTIEDTTYDIIHPAVNASGNPIEITDAAAAPMIKCVSAITGYQSGTGTPSPDNIRPIVAYTEGEIEVRGHNVSDEVYESGYINLATGANAVSTTTKRTINYIKIQPNTQYCYVSSSTNSVRMAFYGEDKSYVGKLENNNANPQIFTTPNNAYYLRYYIGNDVYVGVNYPKTVNIYEPYVGTTHTTTYPSAIYKGSYDVVNGTAKTEWGMIASYAGETLPGEWISDRDEYAPGITPTTGAQVAYALATPTTELVTHAVVRTLSGYNHIESSTGALDITYIKQPYEPIIRSAEQADNDLIRITAAYDAASLSNTDVSINYQDYDALVIYVNDALTQCGVSTLYTREYLDYCRANNRTLTFFPYGTAYISYNILTDKLEYAGDNNQGFYIIRIDGINFRR